MGCFRCPLSAAYRKAVECRMKTAPRRGQWRQGPSGLARRAVVEGQSVAQVAWVVRGPAPHGHALRQAHRLESLRVACGLYGAPLCSRAGRPPPLRHVSGLAPQRAGGPAAPSPPAPGGGAGADEGGDARRRRPAGRRLQVVPVPTSAPDDHPREQRWQHIKPQDTPRHSVPTVEVRTDHGAQALLQFANLPEEMLALCSLPTA